MLCIYITVKYMISYTFTAMMVVACLLRKCLTQTSEGTLLLRSLTCSWKVVCIRGSAMDA